MLATESQQNEPEVAVYRARRRRVFQWHGADVMLERPPMTRRTVEQAGAQARCVLEQMTNRHHVAIGTAPLGNDCGYMRVERQPVFGLQLQHDAGCGDRLGE